MQDLKITTDNIYDIYTIENTTLFPLSFTSNIIIIAIIITLLLTIYLIKLANKRKNKWQYSARKNIKEISKNNEIKAQILFVLIKKIALHKYKRDKIAKLDNEKLFDFLAEKSEFNWKNEKRHFKNIYSQKKNLLAITEIKHILHELKKWL